MQQGVHGKDHSITIYGLASSRGSVSPSYVFRRERFDFEKVLRHETLIESKTRLCEMQG